MEALIYMMKQRYGLVKLLICISSFAGTCSANAGIILLKTVQKNVHLFELKGMQSQEKGKEIAEPWALEIKKGEPKLYVLERQGYMPVYLPIFQEPNGQLELKIDLKKLDSEAKSQLSLPASEIADELVDKIIEIQELIRQKKPQQEYEMAEQLQAAHPESLSAN